VPPFSEYNVKVATDENQLELSLGAEQTTPQAEDDDAEN
jgi:hypothetical protein